MTKRNGDPLDLDAERMNEILKDLAKFTGKQEDTKQEEKAGKAPSSGKNKKEEKALSPHKEKKEAEKKTSPSSARKKPLPKKKSDAKKETAPSGQKSKEVSKYFSAYFGSDPEPVKEEKEALAKADEEKPATESKNKDEKREAEAREREARILEEQENAKKENARLASIALSHNIEKEGKEEKPDDTPAEDVGRSLGIQPEKKEKEKTEKKAIKSLSKGSGRNLGKEVTEEEAEAIKKTGRVLSRTIMIKRKYITEDETEAEPADVKEKEKEAPEKTEKKPTNPALDEDRPYRLIVEETGEIYEITEHLTTIGRSQHNTITLSDAQYISKHHAEILFENGICYLTDVGSKNGTYINNEKIKVGSSIRLERSDVIKLADKKFIFC